MSVTCTLELTFFLSNIRSCNNTSDFPLIFHRNITCDLTAAVKLIQSECLLISTDLQYRICRCIDDHMTCCNLFFCKFIKNLRATGTLVSDYLMSCSLFQFVNQFLRKSRLCKCLKWLRDMKSHHLPVSGHRILSGTCFFQERIVSHRSFYRCHLFQWMQIGDSKFLKIRNMKFIHRLRNMSHCVCSCIPILCSIRHCSCTERINYNSKNSIIFFHKNHTPLHVYNNFCNKLLK